MKVHIISDIEGCAAVVKWEQTGGEGPLYQEARKLYTEEMNAAVRGAKAAGATEIVVMDCHGAPDGLHCSNSLVAEDLDAACEFVVQEHWTGYTAFLEAGCDAALFVGMHAKAGTTTGVLTTPSPAPTPSLSFNGPRSARQGSMPLSAESGAAPSWLVTGDTASCEEARALLGDGLTTVAVKEGIGRFGARNLALKRARELIEEGARGQPPSGSSKAVSPYDPGRRCEIRVVYNHSDASTGTGGSTASRSSAPRARLPRGRLVVGLAAVLLLAGCGTGSSRETTPRSSPRSATRSPPARPATTPTRGMRDTLGFGADEKSQWQYWAAEHIPSLEFRNCGVYGERTDEIAKRLDECAKGAKVLIVQGGINDIAQGRPVEPPPRTSAGWSSAASSSASGSRSPSSSPGTTATPEAEKRSAA